MPKIIKAYVHYVEVVNRFVGRFAMYLVFAMIGVLLYAALSRTLFDLPLIWVVEMAQFLMVAYYILGGGYSMQLGSHVRMDLLYGRMSERKRGFTDSITAFCLLTYLVILLYGGYSSTLYAYETGETNYSAWAPYMAPIKTIMMIGLVLMFLQAIATFFRDLASALGLSMVHEPAERESSV